MELSHTCVHNFTNLKFRKFWDQFEERLKTFSTHVNFDACIFDHYFVACCVTKILKFLLKYIAHYEFSDFKHIFFKFEPIEGNQPATDDLFLVWIEINLRELVPWDLVSIQTFKHVLHLAFYVTFKNLQWEKSTYSLTTEDFLSMNQLFQVVELWCEFSAKCIKYFWTEKQHRQNLKWFLYCRYVPSCVQRYQFVEIIRIRILNNTTGQIE